MPKPQIAFYPDMALLVAMDEYVDQVNDQRKAEGGQKFSRSELIEEAVREYLAKRSHGEAVRGEGR